MYVGKREREYVVYVRERVNEMVTGRAWVRESEKYVRECKRNREC